MSSGEVFGAIEHPHRQAILRVLEREPMSYTDLLARVEPRGSGRGRFNYHLKVLRKAGLVTQEDHLYRLTGRGRAAATLVQEDLEDVAGPPHERLPDTVSGSFLGIGVTGITLLVALLHSGVTGFLHPWNLFLASLWVGSPFLVLLAALHRLERIPRKTTLRASRFVAGAVVSYLLLMTSAVLAGLLDPAHSFHVGGGSVSLLRFLGALLILTLSFTWLFLLATETEWSPWDWLRRTLRIA